MSSQGIKKYMTYYSYDQNNSILKDDKMYIPQIWNLR